MSTKTDMQIPMNTDQKQFGAGIRVLKYRQSAEFLDLLCSHLLSDSHGIWCSSICKTTAERILEAAANHRQLYKHRFSLENSDNN